METSIQRQLQDKLYDKRKAGALELENSVRTALAEGNYDKIGRIVHQLCNDYAYAVHQPHARNGGLIGLAAAAIALGLEVARYLREIIPPVLACFSDQDARVRYYACESMYNIAKVAKGEILIYFNDVFDALSKLAADTELSVKNGAELLDRLVKDIVSESAATYASVLITETAAGDPEGGPIEQETEFPTAFSLPRFIPLLQERINVQNPFARTFLVSWITLLDQIPDLELVAYLPSFLGGLLRFLTDSNEDVHTTTKTVLDRFLAEIKKIAAIKRSISEAKKDKERAVKERSSSIEANDDGSKVDVLQTNDLAQNNAQSGLQAALSPPSASNGDNAATDSGSSTAALNEGDHDQDAEDEWIPGQDVHIDYQRILDIFVTFLSESNDEEIQMTALKWIETFLEICPEDIIAFTPKLLSQLLPALSHHKEHVSRAAHNVNQMLMKYILSLLEEPSKGNGELADHLQVATTSQTSQVASSASSMNRAKSPSTPHMDLDYEAAVSSLTHQFLHEHEATRVAALAWLIMLHRRSPRKILAIQDATFPALLKTLCDPAEAVVTRDLLLLSQISKSSDDSFFSSFMVNLLKLFRTDRGLLETRGNLIIRQLCLSLSAERIYRTMADCLEKEEEDVEFASIMVQNLNNNLLTAPELADLRKRLRNLDSKDGQPFFTILFKAWCVNAVATFSLCLLAQAYEQAYNLLQVFCEIEMTVTMLIQIDKLVQLLESPVFTYLRMQLLEPERHPHLYKCLYGLLMLLPQSSAFAALKNRLNSVSAIGYLHIGVRGAVATQTSAGGFERQNRLKSREDGGIKWNELLEKFRTTQDRFRGSQLSTLIHQHGLDEHATPQRENTNSTTGSAPEKLERPESAQSGSMRPSVQTSVQTHVKGKSSLSHLGRLAGGVRAAKLKK